MPVLWSMPYWCIFNLRFWPTPRRKSEPTSQAEKHRAVLCATSHSFSPGEHDTELWALSLDTWKQAQTSM